MDFPDIRTSWKSFKLSWFRRVLYAKGTWVEVLKDCMHPKIIFDNPQTALVNLDLIQLSKMTKFIQNDFWKEVFKSLPDIINCYLAKWRMRLNIWGSSKIKNSDGEPLDQSTFSVEARNIQYIVDLLKGSQNGDETEKSIEELIAEY